MQNQQNTQAGSFVNYCFSKNNFLNDSIAYVNERSTIKANISRTVRDTDSLNVWRYQCLLSFPEI